MASTDLDTVSPGLSPACYFCGFIVTLDKLLYSIWLCNYPNNGLAWVSNTWNELDMTMNKHTAVAALIVCSPVEDAIDCTGLARG